MKLIPLQAVLLLERESGRVTGHFNHFSKRRSWTDDKS